MSDISHSQYTDEENIFHRFLTIPWKAEYARNKKNTKICPLCDPEDSLVVWKGKHTYLVLNKYPYNVGHAMVVTQQHIVSLEEIEMDVLAEIFFAIRLIITALKEVYGVDSYNIGLNIGPFSGASLQHLHIHIVPRYQNELNFIDILSATRVIIENIENTAEKLRRKLHELEDALKNSFKIELNKHKS
ncbi:MAG: HIT domain-containing protein [Candidatus Korarchaeota archaeon]